jgi:hypothetical protein
MDDGGSLPSIKWPDRGADQTHRVPMLRMHVALPLLLLYMFMASTKTLTHIPQTKNILVRNSSVHVYCAED